MGASPAQRSQAHPQRPQSLPTGKGVAGGASPHPASLISAQTQLWGPVSDRCWCPRSMPSDLLILCWNASKAGSCCVRTRPYGRLMFRKPFGSHEKCIALLGAAMRPVLVPLLSGPVPSLAPWWPLETLAWPACRDGGRWGTALLGQGAGLQSCAGPTNGGGQLARCLGLPTGSL